jgi:hypothetical protein
MESLIAEAVTFFLIRDDGAPVGCAASNCWAPVLTIA